MDNLNIKYILAVDTNQRIKFVAHESVLVLWQIILSDKLRYNFLCIFGKGLLSIPLGPGRYVDLDKDEDEDGANYPFPSKNLSSKKVALQTYTTSLHNSDKILLSQMNYLLYVPRPSTQSIRYWFATRFSLQLNTGFPYILVPSRHR